MMMTKLLEGRLPLAGLMVAVVTTFAGATPPLNPLVIRTDQQRTTVAADCNESLAIAPAPRIDVREIPPPEPDGPPAPPPSAALREALQTAQQAIARNDRAAFDVSLARARTLIGGYPTGGERRAAEELIAMYGDVERLWDAQYRSPFFARESPEFAIANRYPGWEAAVRRSILTDASGTRFYPAGESREYVARAASERLRQTGLATTTSSRGRDASPASGRESVSPRVPSTTATATTTRRPSTSTSATARPSNETSRVTTSRATASPATGSRAVRPTQTAQKSAAPAVRKSSGVRSTSRPVTRESSSSPAPSRSAATGGETASVRPTPLAPSAERSTPIAQPATPTSSEATPVTGPGTIAPVPSDYASGTATDPLSSTAVPADPATAPPGVDPTTALSEPAVADTAATDAATPARGRSVILPLVLILIGLGVLVVLFRMSN